MEAGGGAEDKNKERTGPSQDFFKQSWPRTGGRGTVTLEGAARSRALGKDGKNGSCSGSEESSPQRKWLALCWTGGQGKVCSGCKMHTEFYFFILNFF